MPTTEVLANGARLPRRSIMREAAPIKPDTAPEAPMTMMGCPQCRNRLHKPPMKPATRQSSRNLALPR